MAAAPASAAALEARVASLEARNASLEAQVASLYQHLKLSPQQPLQKEPASNGLAAEAAGGLPLALAPQEPRRQGGRVRGGARAAPAQAGEEPPKKRARTSSTPATPRSSGTALALAPQTPAKRRGESRVNRAGGEAVEPAAEPGADTAGPVVVSDPRASRRCYEALGVHRMAPLAQVRRAFRSKALVLHPDKPGGDHAAFICLQSAYEVIQDLAERSQYDRELQQHGSLDGLYCAAAPGGQAPEARPALADPEALREAFLAVSQEFWAGLLKILSHDNLNALATLLRTDGGRCRAAPKTASRASASKQTSSSSVPGLIRKGVFYCGKIANGGFIVSTYKSLDLGGAIDGRMALLQLKARFEELGGKDESKFDECMRTAVSELRLAEQASAFYLNFSFEHNRLSTEGRQRLTSPNSCDLEVVLRHRKILMSSKPGDELARAHQKMQAESEGNRKLLKAERERRVQALLQQVQGLAGGQETTGAEATMRYKVISDNKVGILPEPDAGAGPLRGHLRPNALFYVVEVKRSCGPTGRTFLRLPGGAGWVAECSRKDPSKVVAEPFKEQAAGALMLEDRRDDHGPAPAASPAPKKASRKSSSSSSSSSPSSDDK